MGLVDGVWSVSSTCHPGTGLFLWVVSPELGSPGSLAPGDCTAHSLYTTESVPLNKAQLSTEATTFFCRASSFRVQERPQLVECLPSKSQDLSSRTDAEVSCCAMDFSKTGDRGRQIPGACWLASLFVGVPGQRETLCQAKNRVRGTT